MCDPGCGQGGAGPHLRPEVVLRAAGLEPHGERAAVLLRHRRPLPGGATPATSLTVYEYSYCTGGPVYICCILLPSLATRSLTDCSWCVGAAYALAASPSLAAHQFSVDAQPDCLLTGVRPWL